MSINLDTVRSLLPREFGKASDTEFRDYLNLLITYYTDTLSSPTLSLVYKMCRLSCIDYLLGNSATKFDTAEIDIQEKESQIFDHYMKLYPIAERQLELEISAVTGGAFSIGVVTKQTPIPYDQILYFNPNNSFFRGRPIYNAPMISELP